MIFLDLKEYELCKCIVDAIDNDHKKIIDLSDEVKKKLREAAEKSDIKGLYNHLLLKGPKSKNILEQEEVHMKKLNNLIDTFSKIQPSFEQVPNIPERDI